MHEEIIFAGFGGQGVLFAGQLLAYTALAEGRYVTWIPSYGPEMRGGTANCTVVISDEPIGSPVCKHPGVAVVFNNPSMQKYQEEVKPGGLLVINQSLVMIQPRRTDIDVVTVPATDMASRLGNARITNMILLGAMLVYRPVVSLPAVREVLAEKLGSTDKAHLLDLNLSALVQGQEAGRAQQTPA